jgi:putative copper resistance protein D
MTAIEVAVRAVSYAAAIVVFGASLFAIYAPKLERALVARLQAGAAVLALLSTATWLLVHAAVVSGQPINEVNASEALLVAVRYTRFGHIGAFRLLLMVAFLLTPKTMALVRVTLAGAAIAAMAWSGHAAGTPSHVHVWADAVHLLAAAAWIGGLVPFAYALARGRSHDVVELTSRFSRIGSACVAALLVSGLVNAWFLVGGPGALLDTAYGRLLTLKVALFAVMLALALVNRIRLTPRLPDPAAARAITRNAAAEAAIGGAIVCIVAALGIMVPAAHAALHMH